MNPPTPEQLAQYRAIQTAAALVDFSDRTQIALRGADRLTLLHNLCTNDTKSLRSGQGREAFLLNVQGKILAHVFLFAGSDSIILETVPSQAEFLLKHFDRYIIREDVTLHDLTGQRAQWLLAGPRAEAILSDLKISLETAPLSHAEATIAGAKVVARRAELLAWPNFSIDCDTQDFAKVGAALRGLGAMACEPNAYEMARVESGTPLFARDIQADNLPQEVARDQQALHFSKGCYLGQETVARIDALGHVNKLLSGVRFAPDAMPEVGTALVAGEKKVGAVTSFSWSPKLGAPLALAYIRREARTPGSVLASAAGEATVIALPLSLSEADEA